MRKYDAYSFSPKKIKQCGSVGFTCFNAVKSTPNSMDFYITPTDIKPFAHRGAALWGNGYLAPYAIVTPPDGYLKVGRYPNEKRIVPSSLGTPIREWHVRLGMPDYSIKEIDGVSQVHVTPKHKWYR